MTTIDIENSKQIRQPMDVIIQIAAAETATLTYSGYSAAKVADGELDEPDWPMRKLADLQGDGFLLDGSAVLYDSTVTASAANGKLGVRSVIGTAISVTVTSDVALQYLTVTASGAESVTYNGTAYSMTSGYALIPVGGGTTFTLTFTPAAADERVEISDIQPGALIKITNDNLISAVVSLRSDLSILEPTLPESEINIEAYFDENISEILAAIPDETPVTYQAGYDDGLSPVRNFYLAEQITWADNVMSIHAVDAVHKLDKEIGTALYLNGEAPYRIAVSTLGLIWETTGLSALTESFANQNPVSGDIFIVDDGQTVRDLVARVNSYLHQQNDLWYTYVDAGRPIFTTRKPAASWSIDEEDCGNVQTNVGRNIATLTVQHQTARRTFMSDIGSATMVRTVGTILSFSNSYVTNFAIGIADNTRDTDIFIDKYGGYSTAGHVVPMVPATVEGAASASNFPYLNYATDITGITRTLNGMRRLLKDGVPQADFTGIKDATATRPQAYTQFIPWGCTYDTSSSYWANNPNGQQIQSQAAARSLLYSSGIVTSTTEDVTLTIGGWACEFENEPITYTSGSAGVNEEVDSSPWIGIARTQEYGIVYPDGAFNSLLSRSPITGSFTWKGDPRMQPRDVFTFHRLDGTDEVCTLENITITHEKGGTSAEITYRKGVC